MLKRNVPYNIIITDDHPMVATGISALIKDYPHLHVTHTLNNGWQLIKLIDQVKVDLIILDISMPDMDGVEVAKIIREKYSAQKILCISTFYEKSLYSTLKSIPVQGFIPKLTDTHKFVKGIDDILEGQLVFITHDVEQKETGRIILNEIRNKLSRREIEIMKLIKDGLSSKDISEALFISLGTVNTHRKNICKKLNIKESNGLLRFAIDNL